MRTITQADARKELLHRGTKEVQGGESKPDEVEAMDVQGRACFSRLPCSINARAEAVSVYPSQARNTPTKPT